MKSFFEPCSFKGARHVPERDRPHRHKNTERERLAVFCDATVVRASYSDAEPQLRRSAQNIFGTTVAPTKIMKPTIRRILRGLCVATVATIVFSDVFFVVHTHFRGEAQAATRDDAAISVKTDHSAHLAHRCRTPPSSHRGAAGRSRVAARLRSDYRRHG